MMTAKVNHMKAEARAKIARLKRSPKYRTFFNPEAIQAFKKVEGSAFAGKPMILRMSNDPSPRC